MRSGTNYTLVLTFDRPVLAATNATIASGVGTVSGLPSFSGNTATVQLSGVADRQTITYRVGQLVGVTGVTSKVFVAMSVCVGDVNQDGVVTSEDINLIRSHNFAALESSTFKYDVNASGRIDGTDVSIGRQDSGDSLFPDFAFTGHYYHARSGLYLAPYRAYNPTISRWLSRDPIGERGGLNLYGYVSNNPINFFDPFGLKDILVGIAWRYFTDNQLATFNRNHPADEGLTQRTNEEQNVDNSATVRKNIDEFLRNLPLSSDDTVTVLDIDSLQQLLDTKCMKFDETLLFAHGNDNPEEPYTIALGFDRVPVSELPSTCTAFGCQPGRPKPGGEVMRELLMALQKALGK